MAKKPNLKKDNTQRPSFNSFEDAIKELQDDSTKNKKKFVESLDIAVMLGIDSKQSNQNVKGFAVLPHGSGKEVKVVVVTPDQAQQDQAKKEGAFMVGFEEIISKIESGFVDFDTCIATPDAMQKLSKAAKKLGPRGLMPSPKNGTVTTDISKALSDAIKGKVSFKNEKSGIVHCLVGKVNFEANQLSDNIKTIIKAIRDVKPETAKGKYINKCYLSTTMGKSVEVLEGEATF